MKRHLRLRSTRLFDKVYREGRSVANPDMVLHYLCGPETATRVGFAVGKRVGTAVARNKVRRRLREIVAALEERISPGCLLVFVVRRRAAELGFQELQSSARELLARAGILKETQ